MIQSKLTNDEENCRPVVSGVSKERVRGQDNHPLIEASSEPADPSSSTTLPDFASIFRWTVCV